VRTLVRAELLKLRTTRTFVLCVGAGLVLSLLQAVLMAALGDAPTERDARTDLLMSDSSGSIILLLGAIAMTGEWRHRTITGAVLTVPDRGRLLAAKAIAASLAGLVLSLVVTTSVLLAGTLVRASREGQATLEVPELASLLGRSLVVAALFGLLGVCAGAIIRNQIAALAGILLVSLVVEPALLQTVAEVGRFGPLLGAPSGLLGSTAITDVDFLAPGVAVVVAMAWGVAAFAAAWVLLRRRDVL
jgi:ABC-2 type transport system permease protein